MDKSLIHQLILEQLKNDSDVAQRAAMSAHDAATNEENIAENRYDTLALEAGYLAEGQSRRLQEIETALTVYLNLRLKEFTDKSPIGLTALITLEGSDDQQRHLFLGPDAAGLKLHMGDLEVLVITPQSPMGQSLLGKVTGDELSIAGSGNVQQFEIIQVC
jgi:transcription elongation GreA/GreB family factor